ncbi:HNH endonuclease [Streptomyces griseoviridis]|uniref:HNH endonuclease n=1 Tax=Streptomyces TaxID=1883 RepID=UPI001CF9EEAD|nr:MULTISPECIES: HNH endonuclease [Streptomyces]
MGLGDITCAGVLAAVQEYRHVGRETFRRQHGFGPATTYELVLGRDRFDSKAIAAVAHLYSVGTLLSTDDSDEDAHTVAHRLRALGFTVQEGAAGTNDEPAAAPQLVLQPRGGARDRGPQNFAKSVHDGVHLDTLGHVLGEHAGTLTSLYPDGVARLWGSTPTTQANNEKARALRGRRVGDDVLFYAENHFIARARILHLFDSSLVAREVWDTDQDGSTWEHIMALGDYEKFPDPVLAAPVLRSLNVPAPLRSLTLRSADSYRGVAPLLPARHRPSPSPSLTPDTLLERLRSLRARRRSEATAPSRHQAISLLWAVSRAAAGKPRLAPWDVFRSEVGPLLTDFGISGSRGTAEYPFLYLRDSGLWEVHGVTDEAGPMPQPGAFDVAQPVAGLTYESADLLKNPLTRLEAVAALCSTQLNDADQRNVLDRLGLGGYATAEGLPDGDDGDNGQEAATAERAAGPTARRKTTTSRLIRNPAIVSKVKELYEHACQVCGECLQYKHMAYSEAAHIRGLGSPHDGPDELSNLLCLCPNHHVLFDGLEIYVDADGTVKNIHTRASLGRLNVTAEHRIDEAYLRYHRTLCELNSMARK